MAARKATQTQDSTTNNLNDREIAHALPPHHQPASMAGGDTGEPTLDSGGPRHALMPYHQTHNMAAAPADAAPQDLESALKQIKELKQHIATLNGRLGRGEQENRQPGHSESWLLDWAIKRDREGLLEAIDWSTSEPSALGGNPLDTHSQAAMKAEVVKRGCFRFMDLAPEIRNRIYDLAANEAFRVPCMVAYPWHGLPPLAKDNGQEPDHHEHLLYAQDRHTDRLTFAPSRFDRLAMLSVSRQVHHESHQIFYRAMSLDIRFMYHPNPLKRLLQLVASPFASKLQFVRHVEVECEYAGYFLFGKPGIHGDEDVPPDWLAQYRPRRLSILSMRRIATLLFNLEAVTITKGLGFMSTVHNQATGLNLLVNMSFESGAGRTDIERVWPRLSDIVTMNDYGAERFRKTGPAQWRLHYSHEALPTSLWSSESAWYIENMKPGDLVDATTRLINSRTLANLGPLEEQGEQDLVT